MAEQVEAPAPPTPNPGGNGAPSVSAAMQKVVSEFLGEGGAGGGAQAEAAPPAPEPVAAKPAEPQAAAPAQEEDDGARRDFAAFAQAQERWGRERERLNAQAKTSADQARRQVLDALSSDDPDGELERLGVPAEARKTLTRRMVLRHVPADKATGELKAQIELDALNSKYKSLERRFDDYVKKQTEERDQERHQAAQRQQADKALETLHDAFRNAGDDQKLVKARYGKRRDGTIKDALEVGKRLAAEGKISSRMSEAEIARKIVKELDSQYRDDFGLADGSSPAAAATPATPPPAASSRPVTPPKNAPEVSGARTISRGATEVTRPPPSQDEPLDEEAWLEEEAKLLRKRRQEGFFSQA